MKITTQKGFRFVLARLKIENSGFSLVEVLIIVMIISVLSVLIATIVNPIDIIKRTRDANRLTDLQSLNRVISTMIAEGTVEPFTYCAPPSGPPIPYQDCFKRSPGSDTQQVNGQGWVRIDFTGQNIVTIPTLPVDPINTLSSGLYYTYCSDGYSYELTAVLESSKYDELMSQDGGNNPAKYELGSNLQISTCD